jgi:hypothetical protein
LATLEFYDAAYPPSAPPAGADGVCGYIGGDALNVWSTADWESQRARYRLPIFVRANPPGPGAATDVAVALKALRALGAPQGTLVAWDMETAADASYIRQVGSLISAGGYKLIVYGSQSSVRSNDNPSGLYWGADWTGHPHIASGDAMTQWVSYSNYDLSEAEATLPFWDTHASPSLLTLMLHDQEGPVMLLLPKGTPTPIAIPDGATSIRFTTVFGAPGGSWPTASLSVNWHGTDLEPIPVTVDPQGTWPVLTIPVGVEGACVYREDNGTQYVSATVYTSASTGSATTTQAAGTGTTPTAGPEVPAGGGGGAGTVSTASGSAGSTGSAGAASGSAGSGSAGSGSNGVSLDSFLHEPPSDWGKLAKRLLARRKS